MHVPMEINFVLGNNGGHKLNGLAHAWLLWLGGELVSDVKFMQFKKEVGNNVNLNPSCLCLSARKTYAKGTWSLYIS